MEQNKTSEQWAAHLPAEYREKALEAYPPCLPMEVINIRQYIALISREDYADVSWRDRWETLLRSYSRLEDREYHVAYWTGQGMSAGKTVMALNFQHASDIVQALTGKTEDQMLYVQCKDSG